MRQVTAPEPGAPTASRSLVDTLSAHMVTPQWAARVVSPLHDVLTVAERRAILAENPDSYLHVTSDPLALPEPPGEGVPESVQARALQRLLDLGAYSPAPEPALFVYRLRVGDRQHTGVISGVAVAGFDDGRVLGHEAVQPDRVAGLVRHYERVPMRSELVTLFYRGEPRVAQLTAEIVARRPLLEFTDSGGIAQSVWQADTSQAAELTRLLTHQRLYVADGHHRVAAALRRWERDGRPDAGSVLCAIYPENQLLLHAFHRHVRGPVDVPALLDGLGRRFDVAPVGPAEEVPAAERGTIGLYAAGRWTVLRPHEPRRSPGVAGLDVTLLHQKILAPLLGIQRGDPRLQFVPDLRELGSTLDECDADGGVLFTLHAPAVDDVVSVAERHQVMSPKATYVQPKPHTGIFLS